MQDLCNICANLKGTQVMRYGELKMASSINLESVDTAVNQDIQLEKLREIPTANIGDAMDRLGALQDIHSFWPNCRLIGRAFTIWTRAGDNAAVHKALELVQPGQIIVINGEADTSRALIGEMIGAKAKRKNVAGFVIDGAVRDVGGLKELGMPTFARNVTPAGPYKNGPFFLNQPIAVGGVSVSDGDIVVGDDDGVVIIPRDKAEEIILKAQAIFEKEENKREILF